MAKKRKKPHNFIVLPQYPGGQKAIGKFIADHLQYPEAALKNNIEGDVFVTFEVSNKGKVEEVTILKGLSPECDVEAIRLIRLLNFEAAHNRGVNVRSNMRTSVRFRLPRQQPLAIQYSTQPATGVTPPSTTSKPQPVVHNYTITLPSPGQNS